MAQPPSARFRAGNDQVDIAGHGMLEIETRRHGRAPWMGVVKADDVQSQRARIMLGAHDDVRGNEKTIGPACTAILERPRFGDRRSTADQSTADLLIRGGRPRAHLRDNFSIHSHLQKLDVAAKGVNATRVAGPISALISVMAMFKRITDHEGEWQERRRRESLGVSARKSPIHTENQETPEPERVTRVDEEAGSAVHELKDSAAG